MRIGRFGDALSQRIERVRREPQRHLAAVGVEEDEHHLPRVVDVLAFPAGQHVDEAEGVVDRQGGGCGRGVSSAAIVRRPT